MCKVFQQIGLLVREVTRGVRGLLQSRKGTLSLLILMCATAALFTKHLDSTPYALVVGTIGSIFTWSHTRTDVASITAGLPPGTTSVISSVLPPRGQL